MRTRRLSVLFGLFFCLSLASASAHASLSLFGWLDPEYQAAQQLVSGLDSSISGELSSIWGAARAKGYLLSKPDYQLVNLPYDRTGTKAVPIVIALQSGNAPLIIINPGLFGEADGALALREVHNYAKLGYHVAVIPNTWSTPFISQVPQVNPGNLPEEARMVITLTRSIQTYIGKNRIKSTSLLGLSYGGFLAAVTMKVDSLSPDPVFNGTIDLLSPPLQFSNGITRLDAAIDEVFDHGIHLCNFFKYKMYADLILLPDPRLALPDLRSCAPALFARAFQDNLGTAMKALHQYKGIGKIPDDTSDWDDALRFHAALHEYVPENLKYFTETSEGNLAYWISQSSPDALKRLRILVSLDDFMNVGIEDRWKKEPAFAGRRLMLLPYGGHLGFEALSGFFDLLKSMF